MREIDVVQNLLDEGLELRSFVLESPEVEAALKRLRDANKEERKYQKESVKAFSELCRVIERHLREEVLGTFTLAEGLVLTSLGDKTVGAMDLSDEPLCNLVYGKSKMPVDRRSITVRTRIKLRGGRKYLLRKSTGTAPDSVGSPIVDPDVLKKVVSRVLEEND